MKKQCAIMVSSGGLHRNAAQCRKKLGLRVVKLIDRKIRVCFHHRKVLEHGRIVEVPR